MQKVFLTVLSVLLIGVGIGTESTTWATPVGPGFDLFATFPPTGMFIPAGTILGQTSGVPVPLIGDPFGPGTTDTIVERKSGVGGPGDPPFDSLISIELVALSLMSVSPVDIPGVSGGPFTVVVVEDPAVASPGTMTISHETPDGGTFTSVLEVHSLVTLVDPGGTVLGTLPRVDTLSGGGTWSHSPPPGFPSSPAFPSGGLFAGPTTESGMLAAHFTQPPRDGVPVPEPSVLLLLGAAVTALGMAARRQRVRSP